jgi:predicted small secreted protein
MKWIRFVTCLGLVYSLLACSTMEGMGKDIQVLGKSIEHTAAPSTKVDPKPVPQPSGAVVTPVQ